MSLTLVDPVPFAVVDVHYVDSNATAACVVAASWSDATPIEAHRIAIEDIAPYVPGRFFERELPCILAVLPRVTCRLSLVIVDGYVELDDAGTKGLGAHLFDRLGRSCAVIGVAKTAYGDGRFATPVLRGTSTRPLYVTAAGIEREEATRLVRSLHGEHRIPTLLEHVDHLARGLPP